MLNTVGQPALWNHSGAPLRAWTDFLVPFFEAVIQEELIPSRREVLETVQLAMMDDVASPAHHAAPDSHCQNRSCFSDGQYQALFNASYRYRGDSSAILHQLIPTTGRYHALPLLPNGTALPGGLVVDGARTAAKLSANLTQAALSALLKSLYPPPRVASEAWVEQIAGRFYVMPAAEWSNVSHSFHVDFAASGGGDGNSAGERGGVAKAVSLSGSVGVSELLIGKHTLPSVDESIRVKSAGSNTAKSVIERVFVLCQSNWAESEMQLTLEAVDRPVLKVTPRSALHGQPRWAEGALTFTLSFAQPTVSVELNWPGA